MTNKEAIEILLAGKAKVDWHEIIEAVNVAMLALKKTMPQKVGNLEKHVDHVKGNCPSCGYIISNYGDAEYCIKCGKKLDWADHEEIKK